MEFHRAFVDNEIVGYLFVQFTLHDVLQHIEFAREE